MRAVAVEQSVLGGEGSHGGSGGLAFLVVSALMLASPRLQASTIPGGLSVTTEMFCTSVLYSGH